MKNNRTFLEKLLDGAEVEWKPLGEVTAYEQPTKYLVSSTVYSDEFSTPVLTAGKTFILGYTDEEEGIYFASKSPVIIFDDFTTANKWVDFDFKAKSSAMKMITSKDENITLLKYIYYWLNTLPNSQLDSDHKRQWISNYANKLIPIPPLSVQTEIVRILDTLTVLTSELTSELILRQKQYEYYREKLLSFDSLEQLNSGGKKKLIDVAIYAKSRISTDKLDKENYIGVENLLQNKLGKTSSNYVPTEGSFIEYLPDDILIGNIRPYLRKIWLADKTGGTNGDVLVIRLTDENIIPRYLYHILANEHFFEYNVKYSKGAKMPRGDKTAILQYEFDVPPLEEQQRIVSILDKFETLTNSITEGLPLAIEQSQKRYEYYRELLLNFS